MGKSPASSKLYSSFPITAHAFFFFSDQLFQVYNFQHLDSDYLQFWERFTSACLNSGSSYPNQGNNTAFNAFPYLHLRFLFFFNYYFSADKDIIQNCRSNYFSFLLFYFYFYLLLCIYLFIFHSQCVLWQWDRTRRMPRAEQTPAIPSTGH